MYAEQEMYAPTRSYSDQEVLLTSQTPQTMPCVHTVSISPDKESSVQEFRGHAAMPCTNKGST